MADGKGYAHLSGCQGTEGCCGGSEEWKGAVIPPAQQRVMKCDAMRRIAIDAFLKRGMMKSPSNPLTTILPLQINSQTFTSTDFI